MIRNEKFGSGCLLMTSSLGEIEILNPTFHLKNQKISIGHHK